jgi:hypothetical protein
VVRGAPVGRILYLPLTEIGFLRISANPKFTGKAVLPAEALALLQRIKAMAEHEFWTDDLPVTVALGVARVSWGAGKSQTRICWRWRDIEAV